MMYFTRLNYNPGLRKRWPYVYFPRMHCQCQLKITEKKNLKMKNFSRINKSTPTMLLSFKKYPFAFLKIFDSIASLGKCVIISVIVD